MTKYIFEYIPNNRDYLQYPVLQFSGINLEKLDFNPLGLSVFKLFSPNFNKYFKKYSLHKMNKYNTVYFHDSIRDSGDKNLFVICPNNFVFEKDYSRSNLEIIEAFNILKIALPSLLYIRYKVYFSVEGGLLNRHSLEIFPKKSSYTYPNIPLYFKGVKVMNTLIVLYSKFKQTNFFRVALDSYIMSFEMSYYSMQFLNLIISLESFIDSTTELNYRLKRGVSILCGNNLENCKNIFSNLNKIYNLRSKIVHGSVNYDDKIHDYIPYLLALVSIFLKELVTHRIEDIKNINNIITELGFGDHKKLSNNYAKLTIDPRIENYIYYEKLK